MNQDAPVQHSYDAASSRDLWQGIIQQVFASCEYCETDDTSHQWCTFLADVSLLLL